ncbi:hypothetical protein CS022_10865 [Veronia nyctiphanis]|uniref:Uncharacterized protein n=1 Tax=Veronia nyctiphanis TaxID=1278244 RepID=A0A4Q0YQE3_9GAMM|nr:hypothetical protein [Veronia nyctiphanis]RXJ73236.1 hypothetical protein CS022_10865 [Veronia nyctiphanis]
MSTERGIDIALKTLDRIYPSIIWWNEPYEAKELLLTGAVVMGSGLKSELAPLEVDTRLEVLNDGHIRLPISWAVTTSSENKAQGFEFLTYSLRPDHMANTAYNLYAYPTRDSAVHFVDEYSGKIKYPFNAQRNGKKANQVLVQDSTWYLTTKKLRQTKFELWLSDKSKEVKVRADTSPYFSRRERFQ